MILRNTSGVVLPPDETTTAEVSTVPTVDGMPDGYVPGESTPPPAGNGDMSQTWRHGYHPSGACAGCGNKRAGEQYGAGRA
nr:hypothetical protein [Enterocloster asparagiformis]